MEFRHTSVLLEECIDNLNIRPEGVYVDGTLGGGGHAAHICEKLSAAGTFIGIDRDQDALDAAAKRLAEADYPCRKYFVQSNYSDIKSCLLYTSTRLNKIEGQVRGIKKMVEDDRYCIDIINQVAAVSAAINSFNKLLLSEHIKSCVVEDIKSGSSQMVDELCDTLHKLMR